MFLGNRFVLGQLVSLQHLFTLPFSLYAMAKIKSKFKGYWKYAFLQVTVMYFAVFYLTQRADNVNCVFESCIVFFSFGLPYPLVWFVGTFAMIAVTSFVLNKIPFLKIIKTQS